MSALRHTALLLALFSLFQFNSQAQENKNVAPIWTFHDDSTNIHGISIGIATFRHDPRNTNTNGIKIELIGIGAALGLAPRSPIARDSAEFAKIYDSTFSERINGISISPLGTICNCKTNGIALAGLGQYNEHMNGLSFNIFYNYAQIHKGLQWSIFSTTTYQMKGMQFSLFNHAKETQGLQLGLVNVSESGRIFQIGLWNVNAKRKLPLFNWNFSKN